MSSCLRVFKVSRRSSVNAPLRTRQNPVNAVATVPQSVFVDGQAPIRYLVRSDRGFQQEVEFLLLGPYGPPGGAR
mgnify:CR=1 FL=1